jgi:hypothetical protein
MVFRPASAPTSPAAAREASGRRQSGVEKAARLLDKGFAFLNYSIVSLKLHDSPFSDFLFAF